MTANGQHLLNLVIKNMFILGCGGRTAVVCGSASQAFDPEHRKDPAQGGSSMIKILCSRSKRKILENILIKRAKLPIVASAENG